MFKKRPLDEDLDSKAIEFSKAIEKYNALSFYIHIETLVAFIVIMLQILCLLHLMQSYPYHGSLIFIFSLFMAYFAADFFNGLIHMILDNNTNYTCIVGPFIAAFHMHHFKISYIEKHPLKIYFVESGHKFWLGIYLGFLIYAQKSTLINANLNLSLVAFGIFSSLAEVSHYWCHNSQKTTALVSFLQKRRVLLSLKHHRIHHIQDNRNYAFLNGISDPLLNVIARTFYNGYKNYSDKHVATYIKTLERKPMI